MRNTTRRRARTLAAAAGAGLLLLTGCSTDSLLERGISMVEGVDDVEIDREDGSFALRNEDGESFGIDIDEEEGTASFATEDGTVVTGEASELPTEIAAVFTPPPGFDVQVVADVDTADGRGLSAQGEVTGEWSQLMDQIEAELAAGPWDEVQRQVMQEGVMGAVIGAHEDGGTLNVSLIMEEGTAAGMLSVLLVIPPDDTAPDGEAPEDPGQK